MSAVPSPDAQPLPRRRRRLFKLSLAALSAVAALLVAELAFRGVLRGRYRALAASWSHAMLVQKPGTARLYELQPGTRGTTKIEGQEGRWTWEINSWGLRGGEPGPRAASDFRVLALGDSYTFGWAVEESAAWPRALERLLAARSSPRTVDVIDAGVNGYDTLQEADYLRVLLPKAEPDVVVLGFVMNDAEPPRAAPLPPDVLYRFATVWLLEDAKAFVNRIAGRELLPSRLWERKPYLEQFATAAPEREVCRAALAEIAGLCKQANVPLLVAVIPDVSLPLDERYLYRPIHATVMGWCRELGVPAIDLLPACEGRAKEELAVEGDEHPTPLAHELFAQEIARAIESLGEHRAGAVRPR